MFVPEYCEYCCRTKIVSGHNALDDLPELMGALKASKPLIVTDRGVLEAGLVDLVQAAVSGRISVGAVESDIPPDSDIAAVHRVAGTYRALNCDSLVAVGGGSVIDTAKGANLLVSLGGEDLETFVGSDAVKRRLRPLIAVPTTSGTGSEVSPVAVVADPGEHTKKMFISHFLEPDVAVLDSRMTLSLPPGITAATAMDAMAHAMEAYTCLAKNPISDAGAYHAIGLISRHLLPVIAQPDHREGRLALAHAATLAGMAFSNSMVGMVHTLGHTVGAHCHIPHGVCMAILLPYGLEYNMHRTGAFTAELLLPLAGPEAYACTPKHLRAEKAVEQVRRMNQDLHDATRGAHPRHFKEVLDPNGKRLVPEERLERVAAEALNDPSILYNPEQLDYEECLAVLRCAWEGNPWTREGGAEG